MGKLPITTGVLSIIIFVLPMMLIVSTARFNADKAGLKDKSRIKSSNKNGLTNTLSVTNGKKDRKCIPATFTE